MSERTRARVRRAAGAAALLVLLLAASDASAAGDQTADKTKSKRPLYPPQSKVHSPYRPDRFAGSAGRYYNVIWGVDELQVRLVESGEMVRFSYTVIDTGKAAPLADKRNEPSLTDLKAGVKLVIPQMEKIGKLRQAGTQEKGKSYWMAFSNKGRRVKKGDHIDVDIGPFRAQGLVVD